MRGHGSGVVGRIRGFGRRRRGKRGAMVIESLGHQISVLGRKVVPADQYIRPHRATMRRSGIGP